MRRPWVQGIVAGLVTVIVLASVGFGAYRLGESHGTTIQVVSGEGAATTTETGTVIVRDGWGHGWGRGPGFGFGFILIPLVIAGVIWLVASRRGWGPRGPSERQPAA